MSLCDVTLPVILRFNTLLILQIDSEFFYIPFILLFKTLARKFKLSSNGGFTLLDKSSKLLDYAMVFETSGLFEAFDASSLAGFARELGNV